MLRLWKATINSRNGLAFAVRSEQAVREEVIALALAVPLAYLIGATTMRRVELVVAVALVLVVELLNTAIEKLADRLTTEHDLQIGRVKDMGSAAVGVALIMAGLFWLFAIVERMGGIPAIQLGHTGRKGSELPPHRGTNSEGTWKQLPPDHPDGWTCVAPSAIPYGFGGHIYPVHELTVDEIKALHRAYADAARRALEAGYKWLEMHYAGFI